ncbi:MAG: hypothetical protein Q9159_007017 [Coniocarpon cinnabarinum]
MDDDFGGNDIDFASVDTSTRSSKPQQPKPQALPSKSSGSSILVSPRQKGNPILNSIRALPWEYADTPADYVLGMTTCALFLSLKYHRLHPEYIYTRITGLQGKYNLRIILTMVDITNHEESLKELSKTSLINNVTIILCWSAQEAGRYLELYKSFEGAAPTGIKAHQSTSYSDKLVDFITMPRSINKTDAVGLVSSFGSIRTAVTARPEEVALVDGWGEKKVERWCKTVREPFRVKKAAKRGINREETREEGRPSISRETSRAEPEADAGLNARLGIASSVSETAFTNPAQRDAAVAASAGAPAGESRDKEPDADEEAALLEADVDPARVPTRPNKRKNPNSEMSEGITAALAKLRQNG